MADSIGYATLPIIPSMVGFGPALAAGTAPPAAAAGAGAGISFTAGFAKYFGPAAIVALAVVAFKGLYEVGDVMDTVTDNIRVNTGAQGEALTGLVDSARAVGNQVPLTLEEIGESIGSVNTRLGYSGPLLEGFTSRLLEVGRIQDAPVNVNDLTAAITGFNVPGEKANQTLDELFQISQATGVPVANLTSSLSTQGAVLSQLGFSLTDSAALLGSLDKAGVNANTVMRSLSAGIVRLAKDGEAPADAFQRVTAEIQGYVDTGNTAAALDLAGQVFGTRGAAQFVGAIQSGVLNLNDLQAAVGATGDTILGVAAETNDFSENVQLLRNNLVDRLAPAGDFVFGTFNTLFGSLTQWIIGLPPLGELFAPALAILTPLAAVVGPALSQAFGAILAAVMPLVPQLVELYTTSSPLMIVFQALTPILPQLAALFSQLVGVIGQLAATVLPVLIPVVVQLAQTLGVTLARILPVVMQLLTSLAPIFSVLVGVIGQLAQTVLPILVPIIVQLGSILSTVIAAVVPIVSQLFAALVPIILSLVQALLPVISAVLGLISPLLSLLEPLFALIGPILTPLIDLLVLLIDFALKPAMFAFEAILPPVLAIVNTIVTSLIPVISSITQVLGGLITFITGVFTGNWEQAWSGIVDVFTGIWNGITGIVKGVLNTAITAINAIIGGINDVGASISDATGGTISFTIPTIPKLAAGADVLARRGGTLAILGEGGQDETVTNLGMTNRAIAAATALSERALADPATSQSELVEALAAALKVVLEQADPTDLSDATIDRLARALAALLRPQSRQGGTTSA